MNRKLITLAIASLMAFGSTAAISVAGEGPGPNGKNDKGLCTAYFNGQKKGHDKHGSPGPFATLEATAEAADQTVYEWCMANASIGGNPSHGRFPECFDGDDSTGNDQCPED